MIGSLLLTTSDEYLTAKGRLPDRPALDKLLLTELCRNKIVSKRGYEMLPPSIRRVCKVGKKYDMPITIKEIAKCELLIISRSPMSTTGLGLQFKLHKFKLIIKDTKCELWMKQ